MINLHPKESAYIDLIDEVSKNNSSLIWWALWLPSKNRFNSPLKEQLFENKRIAPSPFKQIFKLQFYALKMLLYFFLEKVSRQAIKLEKPTYLIKSFSYPHSFKDDNFNDPFFVDLPTILKKNGIELLTIIDPIRSFKEARKFKSDHVHVCSFLSFLDLNSFINVITLQFKSYLTFKLQGDYHFEEKQITSVIEAQCRQEILDPNTFHSLLIYEAFNNIAKRYPINRYLYTYENNPWERLSLLALRKHLPSVKCIGYQHSVVPLASINLLLGKHESLYAPNPNEIITTGEVTKNLLSSWPHNRLNYYAGVALRYQYLYKLEQKSEKCERRLLVVLEGVSQVVEMVNYVNAQAESMSGWDILIRAHPALPLKDLANLNQSIFKKLNIKISGSHSTNDDITHSSVVMYWGSTVGVEALMFGKPLIHFDVQGPCNYDPLLLFNDLKWCVKKSDSLNSILSKIEKLSESELQKRQQKGREFVSSYFRTTAHESLNLFYS